MNYLNWDNPIMRRLSTMGDLIVLNFLWLICCLPVVTAGASTAALYAVALKLARGDDGHMFRRFFKAFRQNFMQATVIHVALCALTVLLVFDFYSYAQYNGEVMEIPQILLAVVCVIAIVFSSWFFPVIAQFEDTTLRMCKNVFQLAAFHLPVTLRITITNVLFFHDDLCDLDDRAWTTYFCDHVCWLRSSLSQLVSTTPLLCKIYSSR